MFLWVICRLMCCEKHEPNSIYAQLPVDIGRGLLIVYFKYKGTKNKVMRGGELVFFCTFAYQIKT